MLIVVVIHLLINYYSICGHKLLFCGLSTAHCTPRPHLLHSPTAPCCYFCSRFVLAKSLWLLVSLLFKSHHYIHIQNCASCSRTPVTPRSKHIQHSTTNNFLLFRSSYSSSFLSSTNSTTRLSLAWAPRLLPPPLLLLPPISSYSPSSSPHSTASAPTSSSSSSSSAT